jgi:hypothetical protein
MPWNNTELWLGDWQDRKVVNAHAITGVDQKSSATQPMWGLDGSSFFADDRTGYWQLYHMIEGSIQQLNLKSLELAEFGEPEWWLGGQTMAALTEDTLVALYNMNGSKKVITVDVRTYYMAGEPSGEKTLPVYDSVQFCPLNRIFATFCEYLCQNAPTLFSEVFSRLLMFSMIFAT